MRKVRSFCLSPARVIGVSVGDTFHNWTKKILINSKKRSQNTHKRVGLYST